ncbi:hypothetical protein KC357_g51 [Hortaea werneckii]|nr:hypothetical protein KC357_g51 [Hortaea werneckii]
MLCTPRLLPRPVHLLFPRPILAESDLGVRGVVEVDLADGGLDQGPHAPVEARHAAEGVDLLQHRGHVVVEVDFDGEVVAVVDGVVSEGADVAFEEVETLGVGRHCGMVTVHAGPFGEVSMKLTGRSLPSPLVSSLPSSPGVDPNLEESHVNSSLSLAFRSRSFSVRCRSGELAILGRAMLLLQLLV